LRYTIQVDFHKNHLEVEGNIIRIGLTSKPEKGKANRELLIKLARHFKVPTSNIRIITGYASRTKLIEVDPVL